MGLHHFDHGRPLIGVLTLQPLRDVGQSVDDLEPALSLTLAACWLRAGMSDKSQETLAALRERSPALRVPVAGREVPIFANNSEAVDWLVGLIGPQPPAASTRRTIG